jgi:hypothetical protein
MTRHPNGPKPCKNDDSPQRFPGVIGRDVGDLLIDPDLFAIDQKGDHSFRLDLG